MGEFYSPLIVNSSGTKDLCGQGLKRKVQGSLASNVFLSKPKMGCKILPFLPFSKSQSYFSSFPLPQHRAFHFESRKCYLCTCVFPTHPPLLNFSSKLYRGSLRKCTKLPLVNEGGKQNIDMSGAYSFRADNAIKKKKIRKCSLIRHLLCSIMIGAVWDKNAKCQRHFAPFLKQSVSPQPLLTSSSEAGFGLLIDIFKSLWEKLFHEVQILF